MSDHQLDTTMSILKLNPDFVTKPLVRAAKDEEFLEKVNESLDPKYEDSDLRQRYDNFHDFFAGATHLPVGTQHIYVTEVNKEKLRRVIFATYKQLLQETLNLDVPDLK